MFNNWAKSNIKRNNKGKATLHKTDIPCYLIISFFFIIWLNDYGLTEIISRLDALLSEFFNLFIIR